MRVALIPPVPDLRRYATTDIHLLLSHLFKIPGYLEYYRTRQDDYLILDNSAHENGVGNSPRTLLEQAIFVSADEVVCPDVLFDNENTVRQTRKMFSYLLTEEGWALYSRANYPRLMFVPQGLTKKEWSSCLSGLMSAWEDMLSDLAGAPPVIGVSKDYEPLFHGGLAGLVLNYLTPLYENMGVDVHCLGWPSELWALARVEDKCPWVRSTDSAKPFVYAREGIRLEPGGPIPEYPHRREDYFTTSLPRELSPIVTANVEVFKATASNELILA